MTTRRRILALALGGLVLLTGCAEMLGYQSKTAPVPRDLLTYGLGRFDMGCEAAVIQADLCESAKPYIEAAKSALTNRGSLDLEKLLPLLLKSGALAGVAGRVAPPRGSQ